MANYYQKAKIPIRITGAENEKEFGEIENKPKEIKRGRNRFALKSISRLLLALILIMTQSQILMAFESHIINVTAHICNYSETRSMGYWKNHPSIYVRYLPQSLGDEIIDTVEKVNQVFLDYELSMNNKLRGQLLTMKFNIAHFGIGEYLVESEGKTLNEIVAEADNLLRDPGTPDPVLEKMKDLLDYLNKLEQVKYCSLRGPEPDVVINEVYYDVDTREACGPFEKDPLNEWLEIYNPTDQTIDISGWIIEDNFASDTIPSSPPIPAGGFAVIAQDNSTWQFWNIPDGAIKIELNSKIGNGLANDGDRVILKDTEGNIIDQMSYEGDKTIWNPAPPLDSAGDPYNLPDGHSLGRVPDGFDIDKATDFKDLEYPTPGGKIDIPRVEVYIPNGGEIWYLGRSYDIKWIADNPTGEDTLLNIDIWYSKDSGQTWFYKVAGGLFNSGVYNWTTPRDYNLVTTRGRIKVIATNPEGLQGWDKSDCDFCPPFADDIIVAEEEVTGGNEGTSATTDEITTTTEEIATSSEETSPPIEETTPEETTTTEETTPITEETTENPVIEEASLIEEQPVIEEEPVALPENNSDRQTNNIENTSGNEVGSGDAGTSEGQSGGAE